ncbi:putative cytochrome P450 [Dioscorea sansibarensis]
MDLFFMSLPLLLLLLLFIIIYSQTTSKKPSPSSKTNLKAYPFLGHLPHFLKHRHDALEWISTLLSKSPTHSIVFNFPFHTNGFITSNPTNIEHILKINFSNYPKGQRAISFLEDFLGHGIFNSDGDHWNWQRKAASYEFNKKSLRNFIVNTVQQEILHRLIPMFTKKCNSGEVFDLQDVFERFSFDTICKVAFGKDPCCLTDNSSRPDLVHAFGDASHAVVERFNGLSPFTWRIKKLLNIGSERRLKESIKIINNFAINIIRSQRESKEEDNDLLSRFALNKDNSDEYLRDIVISFIVAGLETTSSALTWFFWILSTRPDVEEKILEELSKIRSQRNSCSDNYNVFNFDELREMNYLHAAISESLRLYPPVPWDTQSCLEDDVMPDGTFVRKGWFVTYCAYSVGRLKEVWGEDCMEYRPERWLEDGVFRPENPFRYPVFHAGPRMCLGKEMAHIQMKSVVACLIERFRFEVLVDKHPEMVLWLTIRMKGGLPVVLRKSGLVKIE